MIFKERNPQKSAAEKELEAAMAEYEEQFGEPFVFYIGHSGGSTEQVTAEIREMIAENRKQERPEYKEGLLY